MQLDDVGALFGDREAERMRDSGSEEESDREEEEHQEREAGGAVEQDGNEAAAAAAGAGSGQTIKVKKIVRNPQPKLNVERLAGPRGIFALNRTFRNFKFKGKGHERDDLRAVVKVLEHWSHRLFPKLPFRDTLEQIEKLGTKKTAQVFLKKVRLDMITESSDGDGEDNVKRGPGGDDDSATTPQVPVVDVFDELLGTTTATRPGAGVAGAARNTSASAAMPPWSASSTTPLPVTSPQRPKMTQEQKERMERNRKLALEKRLARQRQQQQQEEDVTASQNSLDNSAGLQDKARQANGSGELMDDGDDVFGKAAEHVERRRTQEDSELVIDDVLGKIEASVSAQKERGTPDEDMDAGAGVSVGPQRREERNKTQEDSELVIDDVLEKIEASVSAQKERERPDEDMDAGAGVSVSPQPREDRIGTQEDSEEELVIDEALEKSEAPVNAQKKRETPDKLMDVVDNASLSFNPQEKTRGTQEDSEEELAIEDVLEKIEAPVSAQKERETPDKEDELMDAVDKASLSLQPQEKTRGTQEDSEGELAIDYVLEKIEAPVSAQKERETPDREDELMDAEDNASHSLQPQQNSEKELAIDDILEKIKAPVGAQKERETPGATEEHMDVTDDVPEKF